MIHICISKLTIVGSDNGLSPGRRQAIIWTNAGILLIGPLGTNFDDILIKIYIFSFQKMHLKMSSGNWQPHCLGLNVLIHWAGTKWLTLKVKFNSNLPHFELVCTITHHPFKPGSPNLDQRCKTPWLRFAIVFWISWYWSPWSTFCECLVCPLEKLHIIHVDRASLDCFMVPTVSQCQPSAGILI